jgi:hypothetical protein
MVEMLKREEGAGPAQGEIAPFLESPTSGVGFGMDVVSRFRRPDAPRRHPRQQS